MFDCSCHAWSRGALPSGHTSLRRRFGTQIDVLMWLTLIQMGQHHIEYRDHDHEFLTVSYDHVDSYFDRRLVISVPSCPIFYLTTYAYIYVYNQKNRFHFHKLSMQTILRLSVGLAINKDVCEPDVSE